MCHYNSKSQTLIWVVLEATNTYLPRNHSTSCTFAGYHGFAALLRGSWSSAKLCLLRVGAKLQENNTAWTQQQHQGKNWCASEANKQFVTWQGSKQQSSGLSFRFLAGTWSWPHSHRISELLPLWGFCNSSLPQPGSAFQQQLRTVSQRLLCHQRLSHTSPDLAWLAYIPLHTCRAWAHEYTSNISEGTNIKRFTQQKATKPPQHHHSCPLCEVSEMWWVQWLPQLCSLPGARSSRFSLGAGWSLQTQLLGPDKPPCARPALSWPSPGHTPWSQSLHPRLGGLANKKRLDFPINF